MLNLIFFFFTFCRGPRNLLFVSIMSFSWLRLSPNLLVEILLSEGLICIPQMVKTVSGIAWKFLQGFGWTICLYFYEYA